jgi:hypothetical protein
LNTRPRLAITLGSIDFPLPGRPITATPAGRDLHTDAIHREGKVIAVAFDDFFEPYPGIHARQTRPAPPRPAPAARCNLPVAAADLRAWVIRAM